MKKLLLLSLLFVLFSCTDRDEFYVGKWELNEENGLSILTISENQTLDWTISGFKLYDNKSFESAKLSPDVYSLFSEKGNDCFKLTLKQLTADICLGCNYKCHINDNMIDEVFLARKNGQPLQDIPAPEKETIVIPEGFEGEFFIIYNEIENRSSKQVDINEKGIGINRGTPELKQLFNANRVFVLEGQEAAIPVFNPSDYRKVLDLNAAISVQENGVVVIQKGFNQSPRNQWEQAHGIAVNDSLNIEYFEIRSLKE